MTANIRVDGTNDRMTIRAPKPRTGDKEIKVKIPIAYHVKLHALKIVTGKQMGEAVAEALEVYFRDGASHAIDPHGGPILEGPS